MLLKKRLKSCIAVVFEVPLSARPEAKKEEIPFLLSDEITQESEEEEVFPVGEDMDTDSQEEHQSSPQQTEQPNPSPFQATDESDSYSSSPDTLQKAFIEGIEWVTETLKVVQEVVKDDPALNKKVIEATEAYTRNFSNLTELLILIKGFDINGLMSAVEFIKATDAIRNKVSALRQDTSDIKRMMTEIFQAFKVPVSSVKPLEESSSQPTVKLTETILEIPSNKPGVPSITLIVPGPPILVPPTTQAQPITIINPELSITQREGKGIATDEQAEVQRKLDKASTIGHPDPMLQSLCLTQ
ncbi:hypothetical protein Tco_0672655 [Tanacetum coccineum]